MIHTKSALVTQSKYSYKYRWDDWVPQDRLRKLNDENKELAQNLKKELDALRRASAPQPKSATLKKRAAAGSDLSSTRDSEERHSSVPVTGRGQKRGRGDNEIEKVGTQFNSSSLLTTFPSSRATVDQGFQAPPDVFNDTSSNKKTTKKTTKRRIRRPEPIVRSQLVEDGIDEDNEGASSSADDLMMNEVYQIKPTSRRNREPHYSDKPTIDHTKFIHPQIFKLNRLDPSNVAKREFFHEQDPKETIMLAGIPLESGISRNPKETFFINGQSGINSLQEEAFHSRPAVRIVIPDHLKAFLVDDWENVTKSLQLVPLPAQHSVRDIMDTYLNEERDRRRIGSAEADLLEEIVAGVKEYFDKCIGRILLYRFERQQFFEARQLWEAGKGEYEGKNGAIDVYGAQHLIRLFGLQNPLNILRTG